MPGYGLRMPYVGVEEILARIYNAPRLAHPIYTRIGHTRSYMEADAICAQRKAYGDRIWGHMAILGIYGRLIFVDGSTCFLTISFTDSTSNDDRVTWPYWP